MSTRGYFGIHSHGAYKLSQRLFSDAYPAHVAPYLIDFVRGYPYTKALIEKNLKQIKMVDTYDEYEAVQGTKMPWDLESILYLIADSDPKSPEAIWAVNDLAFAGNGLFCEWGYVIDIDHELVEFYRGYNKCPLTEEDRFYHVASVAEHYNQIKLFMTKHFEELCRMSKQALVFECEKY
jgi:hypothetical protein